MTGDKLYSKAEMDRMIMVMMGGMVFINFVAWGISVSPNAQFDLEVWHIVIIDLAIMFLFMAVEIYVRAD